MVIYSPSFFHKILLKFACVHALLVIHAISYYTVSYAFLGAEEGLYSLELSKNSDPIMEQVNTL